MNTIHEKLRSLLHNNTVLFAGIVGVAFIIGSYTLGSGIARINSRSAISVTGSSERIVESDAAKWTFTVSKQVDPSAYQYGVAELERQVQTIDGLLKKRGLEKEATVTVNPLVTSALCQSQQQIVYDDSGKQRCSGAYTYSLQKTIIVESVDVKKIQDLALTFPASVSSLGVEIQIRSVEFFYTKLAAIKAVMLEEAAKNAKERALAIAKSTGNRIGSVKDASQGVFQITQKNSTDIQDYGSYDTTTIEKKVTAVVRASFEVK